MRILAFEAGVVVGAILSLITAAAWAYRAPR